MRNYSQMHCSYVRCTWPFIESRSAREAFFDAEILCQEIEDKAVQSEVAGLQNWRIRVDSTWSNAFNSACQSAPGDRLPGLFQKVMDAIDERHGK